MWINTGEITVSNTCVIEKMATTKVSSESNKSECLPSILEIFFIFLNYRTHYLLRYSFYNENIVIMPMFEMPSLLTTFYMLKRYSSTLFSVSTSWSPHKSNCNFFTAPIVFYLLGHFWHTAWLIIKALFFPWGQGIICLYSFIHSLSQ